MLKNRVCVFGTAAGIVALSTVTLLSSDVAAGEVSSVGNVLPLNNINQMKSFSGIGDFDIKTGALDLTGYQDQGLRFKTGLLANILPGAEVSGSANQPYHSTFYASNFNNLLPETGGIASGPQVYHCGVGTFSTTVTQFGLTASSNGTTYLTAWDTNGYMLGQVQWVPGGTAGFVGIDSLGVPIAMISYGNDDLFDGGSYSVSGSTIISDTWVWGPGVACDNADVLAQGSVSALTAPAQMSNIEGQAEFDEGPVTGALPLDTYAVDGMTFEVGLLSDILTDVTAGGTAVNPEYSEAGAFGVPSCGPGRVVAQHVALGGVATFANTVTQVSLTASGEGTRYLTAWDAAGAVIGQVSWTATGGTRFVGLATDGTPIAMVAYGDDDVMAGADYDPAADVFSDTWVWGTGCADDVDCDDTNSCSGTETCSNGLCLAGTSLTCSDLNYCTDDTCHVTNGCTTADNTKPCSDGDACTSNDICGAGVCEGTAVDCDDENGCTDESCDGEIGCVYVPNTDPCDDLDACTESDTCEDSVCVGETKSCDDGNECTTDSCDAQLGCLNENNEDPCDDDNPCTLNDVCAASYCTGEKVICEDDNVCTADTCDALGECAFDPIDGCCFTDVDCNTGQLCNEDKNVCYKDPTIVEAPPEVVDEGCSCSTPRSSNGSLAWLALVSLVGVGVYRRRRS